MFVAANDANVNKNSRGLLIDKYLFETAMKPSGCILLPDFVLSRRTSKDLVDSDYATGFYSKMANSDLMKYVNYRITTTVEAGVARKITETMIEILDTSMPADDKFKRFRCIHDMNDEETTQEPAVLTMLKLRKTIRSCFAMLLFFFTVLGLELCLKLARSACDVHRIIPVERDK
ncbi:hypothetical protein HDE_11471 [Halotydeus destructor]|nr:hypothetical protein HDE_11471 [Halotydeus destructor]